MYSKKKAYICVTPEANGYLQYMNKIATIIFASILILWEIPLLSQKEANIWYFGVNAGLDFNTTPPTVLTNGAMNANEGCASIADSAGNLLFYTDGMTVWDKTHNVMANGSGLYGGQGSTSQAALILPKPGSSTLYFIFTNEAQNGFNYGLHFSVVDLSLASGNGSVTSKNNSFFSQSTEKLSSVKHANGEDFWIVTHEFNSVNFRAFLLTAAGLNTVAVTSAVGTDTYWNVVGYLKVSPDGKMLGQAVYDPGSNGRFELYDFDNSMGTVSNPIILGTTFTKPYGCEFSPDGTKFYGGDSDSETIWQWNICNGTDSAIAASIVVVLTATGTIRALQLAPDGRIYVDRLQQTLGIINNPNVAGTGCNYVPLGQSVAPKWCGHGLPNFPNNYFYPGPTLSIRSVGTSTMCVGETRTLIASGANSYTWNSTVSAPALTISPTATSVYTVVGTTVDGCAFEEVFTLTVSDCVGLEEKQQSSIFQIYPNPARDVLQIRYTYNDTIGYRLLNIAGEVVRKGMVRQPGIELDLRDLAEGLYYLKLQTLPGGRNYKVLIQK